MALWIRNVKEFRVKLEWHGDDEVLITSPKDGVIDRAKTESGSNDPAAIGKLMKTLVDGMHKAARAMA